jgi:hypothetical protein
MSPLLIVCKIVDIEFRVFVDPDGAADRSDLSRCASYGMMSFCSSPSLAGACYMLHALCACVCRCLCVCVCVCAYVGVGACSGVA